MISAVSRIVALLALLSIASGVSIVATCGDNTAGCLLLYSSLLSVINFDKSVESVTFVAIGAVLEQSILDSLVDNWPSDVPVSLVYGGLDIDALVYETSTSVPAGFASGVRRVLAWQEGPLEGAVWLLSDQAAPAQDTLSKLDFELDLDSKGFAAPQLISADGTIYSHGVDVGRVGLSSTKTGFLPSDPAELNPFEPFRKSQGLPQYIAVEESDRLIALDLNGLLMKVEKIVPCLDTLDAHSSSLFAAVDLFACVRPDEISIADIPLTVHPGSEDLSTVFPDAFAREKASIFHSTYTEALEPRLANITALLFMDCKKSTRTRSILQSVQYIKALDGAVNIKVIASDSDICPAVLHASGLPAADHALVMRLLSVRIPSEQTVVVISLSGPSFLSEAVRVSSSLSSGKIGAAVTVYQPDTIDIKTSDRLALREADLVVLSSLHPTNLLEHLKSDFRYVVAPPPVDIELFRPGSAAPLRKTSSFMFLSSGPWGSSSGFDALLEAFIQEFSSNDSAELVIMSEMTDEEEMEYGTTLNSIISMHDIPQSSVPTIRLISSTLPRSSVPRVYAAADSFVAPNRGSGWPSEAAEALAAGLPIILMNTTGTSFISTPLSTTMMQPNGTETAGYSSAWAHPSIHSLRQLMRLALAEDLDKDATDLRHIQARNHLETIASQSATSEVIVNGLVDLIPLFEEGVSKTRFGITPAASTGASWWANSSGTSRSRTNWSNYGNFGRHTDNMEPVSIPQDWKRAFSLSDVASNRTKSDTSKHSIKMN